MYEKPWEATIIADIPLFEYGQSPREKSTHSLDLYLPEEKMNGLIAYIHGGGWEEGNNDRPPGYRSLLKAGYGIAAVQYSFAPTFGVLRMVKDIWSAIETAYSICRERNITIPALILWGISAGGHLASLAGHLMMTPEYQSKRFPVPAMVISWCGPMNLGAMADLEGISPDSKENITRVINQLIRTPSERFSLSPRTYAGTQSIPHFFVHGEKDGLVPVAQSMEMYQCLINAGIDCEIMILPEGEHPMPPGESEVIDRTIGFINRILKKQREIQNK